MKAVLNADTEDELSKRFQNLYESCNDNIQYLRYFFECSASNTMPTVLKI
jgi:hypothetical protein